MTASGYSLIDALAARSGIVCTVGAGGKKTTLYRLAATHPGRVGLTATTYSGHFPGSLGAEVVIASPDDIIRKVEDSSKHARVVAFAHEAPEKRARVRGVDVNLVAEIHERAGFEVTLVKADGARSRWIKAPAIEEPVIPEEATTVIPLVSAKAIGEPLSEKIAHRPERVEAVTGASIGQALTPDHIAKLLVHEDGALRNVGDARVVPVLNMVDDDERAALALEAAERALESSDRFDRVILASMRAPDPLVRVVLR